MDIRELNVLIEKVGLQNNKAALSYMYQTGVFYFALAYCGSNLLEIASLFQVSLFIVRELFGRQLHKAGLLISQMDAAAERLNTA